MKSVAPKEYRGQRTSGVECRSHAMLTLDVALPVQLRASLSKNGVLEAIEPAAIITLFL